MSAYTLGKVCLTPRGEYSAQAQYERLDTVTCAGGSFICLQPCSGVDPVTDPQRSGYWSCCAAGIAEVSAECTYGRVTLTVLLSDGNSCSVSFPATDIPDLGVTTQKLAGGAVTSAKIAAGAVTPTKLSGPVLENLLAAGPMILSASQYGPALPSSGREGQVFFLTGE